MGKDQLLKTGQILLLTDRLKVKQFFSFRQALVGGIFINTI
jgi:hypothetical protein